MVKTRVSVFVDGSNMFYTQKNGLGWFFDPDKLLKTLVDKDKDELTDAFWYMGQKSDPSTKDTNFSAFLGHCGYVVRIKPLKTIADTSMPGLSGAIQKANLDIEIVLDMFNTLERYDKCILLSGDSDFERALELLRSRGKSIAVVSTKDWVSKELRNAVGANFIDLQDLRIKIERPDERGKFSTVPA